MSTETLSNCCSSVVHVNWLGSSLVEFTSALYCRFVFGQVSGCRVSGRFEYGFCVVMSSDGTGRNSFSLQNFAMDAEDGQKNQSQGHARGPV